MGHPLTDKGDDSEVIVAMDETRNAKVVIPSHKNRNPETTTKISTSSATWWRIPAFAALARHRYPLCEELVVLFGRRVNPLV
jgi:hypothetical protein